jgi:hypothetical protein
MTNPIATRDDLQRLGQQLRTELMVRAADSEGARLRADIADVRLEFQLLRKDMEIMSYRLVMRLGAIWVLTLTVFYFAMKLS